MISTRFSRNALFAVLLAASVLSIGCSSSVTPEKPIDEEVDDSLPGWTTLSPVPQSNLLWAVHMVDENLLFAAGEGGTVIRSRDGGAGWEILRTGNRLSDLHKIAVSGSFGLAVGDEGAVVRTRDGGATWQTLDAGFSTDSILRNVTIIDSSIAVIVGDDGLIRRTENGGDTWISQDTGSEKYFDVSFLDADRGLIAGLNGAVLWTNDGGRNWTQTTLPGGPSRLLEAELVDENVALVAGEGETPSSGGIWSTDDGGATWIRRFATEHDVVQELDMVDALTGFALTTSRPIRTMDGGMTWTIVEPPSSRGSVDLSASNATVLTCVGMAGMIQQSHDAGDTWAELSGPPHPGFSPHLCASVQMLDKDRAFVGWGGGDLTKTMDGGRTWTTLLDAQSVIEIFFFDDMSGVAAASLENRNTIQRTSDGGQTWQEGYSGEFIQEIHFADDSHGLAIAYRKVLRSTDGGSSWDAPVLTPLNHAFLDVFCVTPDTVLLLTQENTIMRSTDGGTQRWDTETVSFTPTGVDFNEDRTIGIVVGSGPGGSVILRTTDAGASWSKVTSVDGGLRRVSFADAQTIYAVGFRGNVTRSTDGGLTWEWQSSPTVVELMTVDFGDADHGMIGGWSGALLKIETGGIGLGP